MTGQTDKLESRLGPRKARLGLSGFAAILSGALVVVLTLVRPGPAYAAVLTVNSADDADDGLCDATHCSLREAINAANANPGPDEIDFAIPGAGPHHIALDSPLPSLSDDDTVIDGTSEPDYAGSPVVVLQPCTAPSETEPPPVIIVPPSVFSLCLPPSTGLWIEADGTVVRGLSIIGFDAPGDPDSGALIVSSGSGTLIELNYIGLEPPSRDWGNGVGIRLGPIGQTVVDNVISGNDIGLEVWAGEQTIQRNIIGLDPGGTFVKRNEVGIHVPSFYPPTTGPGGSLLIGGSNQGNTISGNGVGIQIANASTGISIQGNRIGTNPEGRGSVTLGNWRGIELTSATGVVIGGAEAGEGNLIAANRGAGVFLLPYCYASSTGCSMAVQILGNTVGLDVDGNPLNNEKGVYASGHNHLIGGLAPGEGNTISANDDWGLVVYGTGNHVAGNIIGTNASGTLDLGNGSIGLDLTGDDNQVDQNVIAFNGDHGIRMYGSGNRVTLNHVFDNDGPGITVDTGEGNRISQNELHSNTELGIDLGGDGVTLNDVGDADGGVNDSVNFPIFTSLSLSAASGTTCSGCQVELFIADADASGYGEGMTFLTSATAASDGSFSTSISGAGSCTPITATTIDIDGNTSEFSMNAYPGCTLLDPIFFVPTIVGIGLIVAAAAGVFASARGIKPVPMAAAGAVLGGVAGAGMIVLVLALPNVMLAPSPAPVPAQAVPPAPTACDAYLDPSGYTPAAGSRFQTYERPVFSWVPLPALPSGEIRWRVDLLGPGGLELNRRTDGTSLPFEAFDLLPAPGSGYLWGVTGERAEPGGDLWQPFCDSEVWLTFQMGEIRRPGPPPWTRPAVSPSPAPDTATPTPTATATPTLAGPVVVVTTPAAKPPTPTNTPVPDTTGPSFKSVGDSPDPIKVSQPKGCSPTTSTISAAISDPSGVQSASVLFFHTTIGQVPMSHGSGNTWTATLGPYTGIGDGTVDYQIHATDGQGNASDSALGQITVLACLP
jgi:CSLREA domain-containing protein